MVGEGSYLVEVWLRSSEKAEELRFSAVFARRTDATIFDAVTLRGKSLLRVRDRMDPAEAPEIRAFPTDLSLSRQQLEEFYRALRPVILLEDKPQGGPAPGWVKDRYPDGRPRTLSAAGGLSAAVEAV